MGGSMRLAWLLAGLGLVGCGQATNNLGSVDASAADVPSGTGTCATPNGSCTATGGAGCVESSLPAASLQAACSGGTFSATACTHTGAVGGCRTNSTAFCQTTWYYAPIPASTAQTACTALHGTFLQP